MTQATRLSLYKLFLPTTPWVDLSLQEHDDISTWISDHRSRTSRRNAIDNLHDTFNWFATQEGNHWWVALGHLNRLSDQIDARIPARASVNHSNVVFRESLRRHRIEIDGSAVLAIRLSALRSRRGG